MSVLAKRRVQAGAAALLSSALASPAWGAPTPGYSERVLQWTVQEGETCADVAAALYGSANQAPLLERYNEVSCGYGQKLEPGRVLVVPEKPTELPPASLYSTFPTVKARAPGAEWADAASGMPLYRLYSVNTLARARADVRFIDRTRIVLSEHTLVVIYETASASNVQKKPPSVELQEGEVQAGLAGLAGRTVGVAVTGGGRVDAKSRDAVLRRTGERTTVSVFDGSAQVESAGQKVAVPRNYGSSFVKAKPPTPPRPLPPAPSWTSGGSLGIVLIAPGAGRLNAAWEQVPTAVKYRLEVARDADFKDLLVREETPPDVRAFRAENMPPGSYFLRVRAVDAEDFLGIASTERQAVLIEAKLESGAVESSALRTSPYGMLELSPAPELELAVGDGPFGPLVPRIDLLKQHPSVLRFRMRGTKEERSVAVDYVPATARIATSAPNPQKQIAVTVELDGVAGIDVPGRVGPRLHLLQGATDTEVPLARAAGQGSSWSATIPAPVVAGARLKLVDARGRELGSADVSGPRPAVPPAPVRIGLSAPPRLVNPQFDGAWWSPSFGSSVAVALAGQVRRGEVQEQASVRVSGSVGALGLDASLASNGILSSSALVADRTAWLGAGYRFGSPATEGGRVLSALALRLGAPTQSGQTTRLEPSVAFGAALGHFTWLGNLAGRAALTDSGFQRSLQGFVTIGGTYNAAEAVRFYSYLDGHLLDRDGLAARAGLSFGLELGTRLFSTLGMRMTPWNDADGLFFGQLGFGIREP